ncbi:uncharacterized protein LOC122298706 [Carya illinoinensis]|uniref:uncharacterized protein LOC122298706 n=1 Tax=Carya illinoinensis TaxID=32201 RepID=UPI001C72367A|nr:uncharacterized protein LOC122298706 [Carya illinoinensis]
MNELEENWRRMRLTEEEGQGIDIEDELPDDLFEKEERSLVGRVCIERSISQEVIESTLAKIWRISRRAKFLEVCPNTFVITFANLADKIRVWEGRPWLFDNHLLVMKLYDGLRPPHKMDFSQKKMWVQMYNLPLACVNEGRGKLIGESIGRVEEVDVMGNSCGWGRCLRVSIVVDLTKPLAKGRTICIKGERLWVSLRYEKLPRMCFVCGCIVHGNRGCKGETKVPINMGLG